MQSTFQESAIKKMEASLKKEAAEFRRRAFAGKTCSSRIESIFFNLTGKRLLRSNLQDRKEAILEVSKNLARQRRFAKTRNSNYDLNRHIALSQLYNRLCSD